MPEILSIKEIEKKGKLQSKAPRVCIVNDFFPPVYSGAGTQAFRLGSRLVRLGIKVSVLTPYSSSLPTHEKMNGMDVNRISIRNVNSRIGPWIYNICLARTLIKTRHTYDVVHFFAAGVSCLFSILVLKALGKKIIITSSMLGGDDLMTIRRQRFGCLRMWLFSYADTFVSISPQITDVSLKASKGNVNIVEICNGTKVFFIK
jgi:glycosyltransferase involved in cell wall biosynthesis